MSIAPVVGASVIVHEAPNALRDSAIRRQVKAQIAEIKQQITSFEADRQRLRIPPSDNITSEINLWCNNFSESIGLQMDPKQVIRAHLDILKELLVDSIYQTPLDNQCYVGSDGNVYGKNELCVFLSRIEPNLRRRSPLDLENPAPFAAQPHALARFMVDWLNKEGAKLENYPAFLRSEDIASEYQRLVVQNEVPHIPSIVIPNNQLERIRLIQEQVRQQQQRKEQNENRLINEISAVQIRLEQEGEQVVNQVIRDMDEHAERANEQLENNHREDQEQIDVIHRVINGLDYEISELENGNKELRLNLDNLKKQISETQQANLELRLGIDTLKERIKKQKKARFKEICKVVLIVGACALGTWALQGAISAAGSSASSMVVPTSGGNFGKLAIKFTF